MSSVSLPIAWRGLNAGSCTPLPLLVCPQPRLLKPSSAYARFYQAGPPSRPRRPPSVQSPFAQLGCYLRWGDVVHLLGGRYPSVIARTGSCAAPVGLSPPSVFSLVGESLQVVTSPCCPRQLPDVIPRTFPWMLDPLPRRYTVCCRLFLPRCHRPSPTECGSASRVNPANDFSQGNFRGCRYFVMFRPPSLLAPRIVPTAANTPAGQLGLLRPSISCFVASARPGYANRLNTGK